MSDFSVNDPSSYPEWYFVTGSGEIDDFSESDWAELFFGEDNR